MAKSFNEKVAIDLKVWKDIYITNNTIFSHGERVWYKRERDGKWKGPAKVIFQDGKIIWVRHGSSAVRVSVNRIVKQGEELYDDRNKTTIPNKTQDDVGEVNDDKENGNRIVEVEDTDVEDQKELALETCESIDNNLDEKIYRRSGG